MDGKKYIALELWVDDSEEEEEIELAEALEMLEQYLDERGYDYYFGNRPLFIQEPTILINEEQLEITTEVLNVMKIKYNIQ